MKEGINVKEFLKENASKMTVKELCDAMGVHDSTVYRNCIKLGVKPKNYGRRSSSRGYVNESVSDMTVKGLSEKLGVCADTLHRACKKLGLHTKKENNINVDLEEKTEYIIPDKSEKLETVIIYEAEKIKEEKTEDEDVKEKIALTDDIRLPLMKEIEVMNFARANVKQLTVDEIANHFNTNVEIILDLMKKFNIK